MSCGGSTMVPFGGTVYTKGNNTADAEVVMSGVVSVQEVSGAKIVMEVEAIAGNVSLERGVQYSNDGVTWGTMTELGAVAAVTAVGWSYGGAFVTLDDTKRYARFGLLARNGSGSDINLARVRGNVSLVKR